MIRQAGIVACVLLLLSCTEQPGARTAALEEALVGTRQDKDPAAANARPVPLARADPHHLLISGTFVLRAGPDGPGRSIQITRNIFRGKRRSFRVEELRLWTDPTVAPEGKQDGRQAVYDGERLAVRRSWGPWMDRETVGGQHERLLHEAHDIAPAVLEAFAPYIVFRPDPEDESTIAGLKVRWEHVALDRNVAPRPMDAKALSELREHNETWKAWLAATHKPLRIEGRVARRVDGTQELVAGNVTIEGMGRWGGRARDYLLLLSYEMNPLPPHASFTLPDERHPARRDRPWKMIDDALGEDLLSPYKR